MHRGPNTGAAGEIEAEVEAEAETRGEEMQSTEVIELTHTEKDRDQGRRHPIDTPGSLIVTDDQVSMTLSPQ